MRIPKVIHRIRLGTDVLPPEAAMYEARWKELHPAWEHRTWTMDNLPPLVNRELFEMSANTGHRADVLRVELLARFGGVYVDLDVVPQRPLDALVDAEGCEGFLGRIRPVRREACVQRVETAVMAAAPGNAFIAHLVESMPAWALSHRDKPTAVRTGPQFVQVHLDRWLAEGRGGGQSPPRPLPMTLLPPDVFYPYLWDEPQRVGEAFPEAYAIHRWWGTWRKQGQELSGRG